MKTRYIKLLTWLAKKQGLQLMAKEHINLDAFYNNSFTNCPVININYYYVDEESIIAVTKYFSDTFENSGNVIINLYRGGNVADSENIRKRNRFD